MVPIHKTNCVPIIAIYFVILTYRHIGTLVIIIKFWVSFDIETSANVDVMDIYLTTRGTYLCIHCSRYQRMRQQSMQKRRNVR